MDEHALRRMLEGGGGLPGAALRTLLYLPGKAYGLAMRVRRAAYDRGVFASEHPGVPVIAVGNLTAGGSGKTPMVALLAGMLRDMGRRPAILLRGYRAAAGGSDEAALYRTLVPDVPVQVNPDRRAGARAAVREGADALIMDDGFQHRKLRRDLDIVLVDATAPWGGGNCLPGGLLREPPGALVHAGVVILTRADQVDPAALARLRAEVAGLAAPGVPILTAAHQPARLARLDGTPLALDALRDREVVPWAGIARPEAFAATLAGLGARVGAGHAGADHRDFDAGALAGAAAAAAARGAVVVTTEKDRAKGVFSGPGGVSADKNIWVLGVDQRVDGEAALVEKIRALFP